MSKNILITGGAGFIGSKLSLALLKKGYKLWVLDNLLEQVHGANPEEDSQLFRLIKDKVEFIRGSVCIETDWQNALQGIDIIVHLAAETGTGQSMYEIKRYTEVNIMGTANMLNALANTPNSVTKIILASSRAVYGEGKYHCSVHGAVYPEARILADLEKGVFDCKCPICNSNVTLQATDENAKIHPASIYGITKHTQEELIATTCNSLGISFTILRYQNVYGAGQSLSNPYTGILSIFSTQIKNNNQLNLFEDGLESRDFIYIDDVVEATVLSIEKPEAENMVFNIGTGVNTTVLSIARNLFKNYQVAENMRVSGNFRIGDIRHNFADISKANKILNFIPKISFEQGIEKFCAWVNTQDKNNDLFNKSLEEMKSKGIYK